MKSKFGFSLLELLIAIMVGMLLLGFGTLSLNNFHEKQKVISASQELLSELMMARNYAITNQLPNDGNKVAAVIDSGGLVVIKPQDKNGNDLSPIFFSGDITPDGVLLTSKTIEFSVSDGRSINGAVGVSVVGTNLVKNIKIDESGLIYEEK